LGLTLYVELVWLPKTRLGKGMIVQATVRCDEPAAVGRVGYRGQNRRSGDAARADGLCARRGRRYEAFCPAGHVAKGAVLRVAGQDNFRLIVTKT